MGIVSSLKVGSCLLIHNRLSNIGWCRKLHRPSLYQPQRGNCKFKHWRYQYVSSNKKCIGHHITHRKRRCNVRIWFHHLCVHGYSNILNTLWLNPMKLLQIKISRLIRPLNFIKDYIGKNKLLRKVFYIREKFSI